MKHLKDLNKLLFCVVTSLLFLVACSSTKVDPYEGQSGEEIYKQASQALANGDYASSVKAYEALETRYPFGDHAERVALNMIYAYYKAGDFTSATAAANRFIHVYPRSVNVDYAYYMKGVTSLMRDRSITQRYIKLDLSKRSLASAKQAYTDFGELIRLYPNSKYTADARQRMIYLRNLFAKHELNVAIFYYDRQAYLSASRRASNIVLHYQQSPYVPQALAIMAESYREMDLPELAEQSSQLLTYNFPDSNALETLKKGNSWWIF